MTDILPSATLTWLRCNPAFFSNMKQRDPSTLACEANDDEVNSDRWLVDTVKQPVYEANVAPLQPCLLLQHETT